MSSLVRTLKAAAYRSGLLNLEHRRKNRQNLTVAMFHRILPAGDPRTPGADPAWTLYEELFCEVLDFFGEHYSIVSPEAVLAFGEGEAALPERPLLLTFDDGWADNAEVAAPRLTERGLRGLVFVVSDAVNRREAFWQERLIAAGRTGAFTAERTSELAEVSGLEADAMEGEAAARSLVRGLLDADAETLRRTLKSFTAWYGEVEGSLPAQMLSEEQVRELDRGSLHIGSHGRTHTPLLGLPDAVDELRDSRDRLGELLGRPVTALSYPHGRYDEALAEETRKAGYLLIATSDEHLNDFSSGALPTTLGRIDVPAHEISDAGGRLDSMRLAYWMFRRPARGPHAAEALR
ncbi:MAG: polysaccharide deacetylase family protein [Planctomycetota bacterium]